MDYNTLYCTPGITLHYHLIDYWNKLEKQVLIWGIIEKVNVCNKINNIAIFDLKQLQRHFKNHEKYLEIYFKNLEKSWNLASPEKREAWLQL